MTKMQIIAKAALTFIGLSAINNLCQYQRALASTVLYEDTSIFLIVLFFSIFLIVTIAIAHLFIFKNDWLAYKLAGSGEKLDHEREILWLVYALRIVAVLYGLMLLATSIPTILNIIVSPLYLCHLINEIIVFKTFNKIPTFTSSQWLSMIYNFLKAILAVYLLYGWPQFIRFQSNIRKNKPPLNQKQYIEGIKNE